MTGTTLQSVYADTAPPAPYTPALVGRHLADLVVIGAGYTGLSAALHAAEQGLRVVLLEAHEPGFGAAGRNGGQVNPGLKYEPDDVESHFGPELGAQLVDFAGGGPDFLFGLIARLGLSCEAHQSGTVRAACRAEFLPGLDAQVAQWARRGVAIERLDADATARITGTDRYVGCTRDPRGGSVNPLALARELTRAAQAAGVMVAGQSAVLSLKREQSGWCARTQSAEVTAAQVVIATDGYSDRLWPGLRESIVPVYSSIAATAPLPAPLRERILATGEVVYESGHITTYYRIDGHGRLLMGGRGVQRAVRTPSDHRHLMDYARRLWPDLESVPFTHFWNGQFALTPDFYPRIHQPAPGVHIALGYSGRGVALATRLGSALAATVAGVAGDRLPLPVTTVPRIPFHRFWPIGVYFGVALGRLRDRFGR